MNSIMPLKHRLYSLTVWLSAGLIIVIGITFGLYAWSEKQIDRTHEQRLQSFLLADELRQSSDDLSRMARTFVITGDPVYKENYQAILDIRNGLKPRPVRYQDIYWDLVDSHGLVPRPYSGQSIALMDLMKQVGFSEAEFQKLALSKANSDRLASTEFTAMQLVESNEVARARLMMHDASYHEAKAAIMKPLYEFNELIETRTLEAVHTAQSRALMLRIAFFLFALCLLFMLYLAYKFLHDTLGGSVEQVYAHITRIGSGDFQSSIKVAGNLDNSILGWLAKTQLKLKQSDRKRWLAEEALRHSELHYRTVADFTSDWEYWILEDGAIRYISPSCLQVSGYTKQEFMAQPQLLTRIIHPDDQPLYAGHTHQFSAQGVPEPIDYRILTKAGETRWISHVCRPVYDLAGAPIGQRASNRDITKRKHIEMELKRANQELQRFAEVTAHHLQEPVRRMASYAERLTRQLDGLVADSETGLSLKFIGQQARRMKNLLSDIERYMAADRPRGKMEMFDTRLTIQQIITNQCVLIAETGAVISVGELPQIWMDLPRLVDLFTEPLENALHYGAEPAGAPLRINISGERIAHRVRYCISDNGCGIETQYRKQVFGVFERLTTTGTGTGIGLAIVSRIAESCGGCAWTEETPGGGCSVLFEVPD